jgi:hypothetical protein
MERVGLLADARRLTDRLRILRSMPDGVPAKEAMCVAACEAFQIEPSKIGLLYHRKPGVDEPVARRVVAQTQRVWTD